jgi:Putative  PD-(D/E)XK family member, (DUF4420)
MTPNTLVSEIREGFANLTPGKRAKLYALPAEFPAWVYATQDTCGVAIAAPDEMKVSERFAGARVYTERIDGGVELRLECNGKEYRNEFAAVCAQFLEPGASGEERARLLDSPLDWWIRWRELLGNAVREKKPYSVLGELLAFERLLVAGEEPEWLGPATNSHDIEARAASYEVKSTVSKYSSTFHVAGQYQLRETVGKSLFIVFQRFEPSTSGESINSVVARLKSVGRDTKLVESALSGLGYEVGTSDREVTYQLLQSTKYLVDGTFPRITESSFVGGLLPNGIVSIEYDVDLAGIPGLPF